jgi:transcriptional regulator with XRE-family HTH domain
MPLLGHLRQYEFTAEGAAMGKPRTKKFKLYPVAVNITALREARKLTQKQFADLLKVNVSQLARTETGKIKPSIEIIMRCMEVLKITATRLIEAPGIETERAAELDEIDRRVHALDGESMAELRLCLSAWETGRCLVDPQFKRGPRIHRDDDGR